MHKAFALLLLGAVACGNRPPGPALITLTPAQPTTLDDLAVVVDKDAFEPEGQDVTYRFDWYRDGELAVEDGEDTLSADVTAKGDVWRVEVTASDGDLAGDPIGAEVTIVNSPPSVTVAIAPEVPYSDDDLVATATVDDPDGDAVTLDWAWTRNGQPASVAGDTVPASQTARFEVWQVTVTPYDGTVEGEQGRDSVEVVNAPPEIAAVEIEPDPAHEDDLLEALVEVADADGDIVTLSYAWSVDGAVVQMGADATLDGTSFDKHQVVSVEVSATDPYEAGAPMTSDEVEVLNSPPEMSGAVLDPAILYEGTTVTCLPVDLYDADGDAFSNRYAWYVGGVQVATTATLDGADFSRGDEVFCSVTANDGEDDGPSGTSPVATVQNSLPVIGAVSLSTTAPAEGDTITATVTGVGDDDGDTVTTRSSWTVEGAVVSTGTSLSSAFFDKHETIVLTVTANDGYDDGLPVSSAPAVAVNTPPTYTALTTSPTDAVYLGSLLALPSGWSDADGDAQGWVYAWTVDGAPASTSASLDLAAYDRGASVDLAVQAWDGDDLGTTRAVGPLTIQALYDADDADHKLLGDAAELAGTAVALSADLTGDGWADAIVGSPDLSVSGSARGGVNLVSHPTAATIDMDASVQLSGVAAGDDAGAALAAAGDINADGQADLIVGAPGQGTYASGAGAAYVLVGPLGAGGALGSVGWTLYGQEASAAAGSAVAGAGDLDGDGRDDLAVGAYGSASQAGAVYLTYGPVTTSGYLAAQDVTLTGEAAGDQCGFSLALVGDTDGDGLCDLLIGAPGHSATGTDRGAAYLLLGPTSTGGDIGLLADGTLAGQADWDFAGYSVARAGDVDGDGQDDLLVGSRWQDGGGSGSGAVYLVLAPLSGSLDLALADAILLGGGAAESAGSAIASAGDIDGDGGDDLMVGAPGRAEAGANAGAAYVVAGLPSGTVSLPDVAWARIDGATAGDKFGTAVAGGVDGDADGTPDVLLGAPWEDSGGLSAGAACLFSGRGL